MILPPDRPALMGILNVTPDSFSDGGLHFDAKAAIEAGFRMMEEGADLIDVGGESTRPNAEEVPMEEELRRVLLVIEALVAQGVPTSIDTMKSEVAKAALQSGAALINDVTALSNPEMATVAAQASCTVCLMHMKGTPRTMQQNPTYEDVVSEVKAHLLARAAYAQEQGVKRENIWIDPGIGFGKTVQHNLILINHLEELVATGYPVLFGASRKSFIGRIGSGSPDGEWADESAHSKGPLPVEDRLEGTLATQVIAQIKGAKIIRAHDVKQARRAIDMTAAIQSATG